MKTLEASQKALLGIGIACMIVTIIVVPLINPIWTPMAIICFIGLVWAEVVLFGGIFVLNQLAPSGASIFLRVGGNFAIIAGAAISFVLSMIFFPFPAVMIPGYIAVQIIVLLGIVIVVLIILFFEKRFRASDEKAKEGISYIDHRSAQVVTCARKCTDAEIRKRLEHCADDLKNMDTTIQVKPDFAIDSIIQDIEEDIAICETEGDDVNQGWEKLKENVKELELAIANRREEASLLKRGGF